jgi:hypothetical protein
MSITPPEGTIVAEDKLADPTYGDYVVFKSKDPASTAPLIMGKRYVCDTVVDQGRLETLLDQRVQMNDGNNLTLYSHHNATPYLRVALWENPVPFSLEREIASRRSSPIGFYQLTRFFNESEAWSLLQQLCHQSIKFCRKLSRYHGDIQPKTVVCRPNGTVVLNDVMSYNPHQEEGYIRMVNNVINRGQNQKQVVGRASLTYFSLLSPQACEDFNRLNMSPLFDKNKNEVFSIALTVLATVGDVPVGDGGLKSFYTMSSDGRKIQVNYENINRILAVARSQQQRPQLFVDVLRIMLSPNEVDRPSLYQVLEFLKMAAA